MVSVTIAIMFWFRSSQAAASARRMMAMMKRIGPRDGDARWPANDGHQTRGATPMPELSA
jgi:hypothetical protein